MTAVIQAVKVFHFEREQHVVMVRLRAVIASNGVPLLVTLTAKDGGARRPDDPPRCPAQALIELAAAAEPGDRTMGTVEAQMLQAQLTPLTGTGLHRSAACRFLDFRRADVQVSWAPVEAVVNLGGKRLFHGERKRPHASASSAI